MYFKFILKKYLKKYLNKIGVYTWDKQLILPRMTFKEYIFFKYYLSKHSSSLYLESGSGGSTIIASKIFNTIHSYETDYRYTNYINTLLGEPLVRHVSVGETKKFGYPENEYQQNAKKISEVFKPHLSSIKHPYSIIFLDGRCRILTSVKLYDQISEMDYLIVHDFNRPHYKEILEMYNLIQKVDKLAILRKKKISENKIEDIKKKFRFDFR